MPVRYPPANEKLAVLHISSSKFSLSRLSQMQNQAIWRAERKGERGEETQNKLWFVGIFCAIGGPTAVTASRLRKYKSDDGEKCDSVAQTFLSPSAPLRTKVFICSVRNVCFGCWVRALSPSAALWITGFLNIVRI